MQDINVFEPLVRNLVEGMGQAVGERTILRKKSDGSWENWGDVANRVALGNALLCPNREGFKEEYRSLRHHIAKAVLLMSGRHLQHGDDTQPDRTEEVFTNCLHRSTKILTLEHGPIEIEKVVDQTVTVKARDGEWRPAQVKSYGTQMLYKIRFGSQFGGENTNASRLPTVIVTANHRWFLRDGSVTETLTLGDMLEPAPFIDGVDDEGIQHGLIFGDGTGHKRRLDYPKALVSQGRTYASIRLCGKDKDYLSYFSGYTVTYPAHANGDPVVYLGKKPFWKELPFTTDPSYIAGFIKGWWLADGSKTYNAGGEDRIEISTSREDALHWLLDYAGYAGYVVSGYSTHERKEDDGSFPNGKTLYSIRLCKGLTRKVIQVEAVGDDEVFCVEEPVTHGFVLANGLLTGNCSTAATSFAKFLLLLSGSGVGRCYDDDMMLIDWDNAPNLRCVLSHEHADFDWSAHESTRDAQHKYGTGRNVIWHKVGDSREGWAKALEIWETMAYEKIHREKTLVLDFSDVRRKGSLIHGMQNRPASGPVPLMNAFQKAGSLKGCGLDPWRQTLYIDHYFSECVLVGGARRSARMSTKFWRDLSILDFITVKRPIEFLGKSIEEIIEIRNEHAQNKQTPPMGFLWSSNNSITVDAEFWSLLEIRRGEDGFDAPLAKHARRVFKLATEAAYADGTGEPGFINVDKLTRNNEGWEELTKGDYIGSYKYQVDEDTKLLLARLARVARKKTYCMIVNPCGEIPLTVLAGFCTIADVVPFHADTLDEAEDAFRTAARALMRVNLMDSIYRKEVERTGRIGVGMTGVHEFAWKFFRCGFRDLIAPDFDEYALWENYDPANWSEFPPRVRAAAFWMTLSRFNRAVREETIAYAEKLGVTVPHTCTTIKPSGSVSKLFALTEGWHLPPLAWMLRWVQFRQDDPLVEGYRSANYPTRELIQYTGTVIVGFPTAPTIAQLGMGDKLVLAGDATPEEQYQWLMLGEKYWLIGVDETGEPVPETYSGQISYTLKFKPDEVDYKHFREMLIRYQSQVKCCAVMPQVNNVAYEYLPEEAITKARYEEMAFSIQKTLTEDVGREHLDCATGACPIDIRDGDKAELGMTIH